MKTKNTKNQPIYILKNIETSFYNPKYGDHKLCICGHPYISHFKSDIQSECGYCYERGWGCEAGIFILRK